MKIVPNNIKELFFRNKNNCTKQNERKLNELLSERDKNIKQLFSYINSVYEATSLEQKNEHWINCFFTFYSLFTYFFNMFFGSDSFDLGSVLGGFGKRTGSRKYFQNISLPYYTVEVRPVPWNPLVRWYLPAVLVRYSPVSARN